MNKLEEKTKMTAEPVILEKETIKKITQFLYGIELNQVLQTLVRTWELMILI